MTGPSGSAHQPPPTPQAVDAPLTRAATFLVVRVADNGAPTLRATLAGLGGLVKTVAFRDQRASLTCTVGIGADIWPTLIGGDLPAELHPFREVTGATHHAPSTPGDLIFHIRADWTDLCFEFERLLLAELGEAVSVVDETRGFRYFDARDLLGFVDGTANPVVPAATLVGEEDAAFAGGSYLVGQKYLHALDAWQQLSTETQETIIGRTKPDNVELPDSTSGQKSHKTLATVTDDHGVEHDIVRDNMPFGSPGAQEFGTYFLGYSRHLWVIEKMLERMFIGDPPGDHDRLLDFSTPRTGYTFFAPSADFLGALGD